MQVIAAWRQLSQNNRHAASSAVLENWTTSSTGQVFAILELASGEKRTAEIVDSLPALLTAQVALEPVYRLARVHADTGYREYGIKYRVRA